METIKKRIDKAWSRVVNIKHMINNPAVSQFGCLLVGVTLVNSNLLPILSYSAEVWLGAPMYAVQIVKSALKKMVFSIFEIPVNTKIAAVYMELGMTRMRQVVQKLQLMYINKVLLEKQGTLPFTALISEWKALGDASMLMLLLSCMVFPKSPKPSKACDQRGE